MKNQDKTLKCDYCFDSVDPNENYLLYIGCPKNHLICKECLEPHLQAVPSLFCSHDKTEIQLLGKKLEDFRKYEPIKSEMTSNKVDNFSNSGPNICMKHKKKITTTCQTCTQKLCDDCTKNNGHQCILMKSLQRMSDRIVQLQNDKKESFKAAKAKCLKELEKIKEVESKLIKKFGQIEKDFDENRIPPPVVYWNQEEKPKLEKLKTQGSLLDEEALKELKKSQEMADDLQLEKEIENFSKLNKGLEKNLDRTCFTFSEKFNKFINSIEMDILTEFYRDNPDGRYRGERDHSSKNGRYGGRERSKSSHWNRDNPDGRYRGERDHSSKNERYGGRERSKSSHWSKDKNRNDKSRGPSREPKRHWSKGKNRNEKSRGLSREPKRSGRSRAPSEEEKTDNLYLAQGHNALQGNQPEPVKIQLEKVRDTIKRTIQQVEKIHVEIPKETGIILTTLQSQSLDNTSVKAFNDCLREMGQTEKNSITGVNFNLNALKAGGIDALSRSLLKLPSLKDLTLKFTRTDEMDIKDFSKIEQTLVKMNYLESLNLDLSGWNWLTNKAMEITIGQVCKIPKIKKVTLNFSELKNLSDLALIQSLNQLRNAPHLEKLYIIMQNCSITDACLEGITKKCQNIPHFKKLTLNLGGCSKYTEGKKDFGDKLSIIV